MSREEKLKTAARTVVRRCMQIGEGERVLVVTDTPLRHLANIFFVAACEITANTALMETAPLPSHGSEPPPQVSVAMSASDVVLAPSSRSLTHTRARRRACGAGARVATMPGITADIMERSLDADYGEIAARTARLKALLDKGAQVRVTTGAGTDIRLPIGGRRGIADNGIYGDAGSFGNLPAGEAFIAPDEGRTEGLMVIDGAMAGLGRLESPIEIEVEGGYATRIAGSSEAERLRELLAPHGREARNIAELGIGTNHRARITGNILEDEKVMGTVHIALGDNSTIGGSTAVDSHLDGIITEPTVTIDGERMMESGSLISPLL